MDFLFWEVDKYINADTQQRSVKSSEYQNGFSN